MKLASWLLKWIFSAGAVVRAEEHDTGTGALQFRARVEHVPLIVVMLVCVALGALFGALALSLPIYKMRREGLS